MAKSNDERVSYLYGRDPSVDRLNRPRPKKQVNLFGNISEEHDSDSSDTEFNQDTASVYLRLRPTKKRCSLYKMDQNILKTRNVETNLVSAASQKDSAEKHFQFTSIFDEQTTQAQMYNSCVRSAITNDTNLTVLTYGTSGSGKTYTLLGGQTEQPGIIPRAIVHIFSRFEEYICKFAGIKVDKGNIVFVDDENLLLEEALRKSLIGKAPIDNFISHQSQIQSEHDFKPAKCTGEQVFIWVSFAEIYNECVYDLLNPSGDGLTKSQQNHGKENGSFQTKRKQLKIISNDGNAFIKDLTAVHVQNSAEAFQLMSVGQKRVTYASTNINLNSSRSHCIFFMDVIRVSGDKFINTTYKFCDLAGSERLKKTDNIGNRLKEAQNINNSLMVLGRCLDAVYHNHNIVPFRESKLTNIIQAALLGKEKITMVVNMLPTSDYYEENQNVLNFASMAHKIVYKPIQLPKKNARTSRFSWFIQAASSPKLNDIGNNTENSILFEENQRLKIELDELKQGIEENELQIKTNLIADFEERMRKSDELWQKRLDHKTVTFTRNIDNDAKKMREYRDDLELIKRENTRYKLHSKKLEAENEKLKLRIEQMEEQLKARITELELELSARTLNNKIEDDNVQSNEPPRKRTRISI